MRSIDFPRVSGEISRGRPKVADDPIQRRRHLRAAYFRLVAGRTPRWIAAKFRCSLRSVHYWVNAALTYDDPEAQALRELVGRAAA